MSRPIILTVCIMAPANRGSIIGTHILGTHVPVEEPSTASKANVSGVVYDDEDESHGLPAAKKAPEKTAAPGGLGKGLDIVAGSHAVTRSHPRFGPRRDYAIAARRLAD